MCGIAVSIRSADAAGDVGRMTAAQMHRGPDGRGSYENPAGDVALGHARLAIIDRSAAAAQPMRSRDGRLAIVFNGEVYNYRELRHELGDSGFTSHSDTEVVLAAYERWGAECLGRLIGMFAFVIWDDHHQRAFVARDRFGVKPLFYAWRPDGALLFGSEVKALHAAGIAADPDPVAWATYFVHGVSDHGERTFWRHIHALPAGHSLTFEHGRCRVSRWYDFAAATGEVDTRSDAEVIDEYAQLLRDSVRLRFRADVPVGINLSGGLDSSTLLGVVDSLDDDTRAVTAFTFVTGDDRYDELPWVRQMLAGRRHPLVVSRLDAAEVPELALSMHAAADQPVGGLPTLAYARLFEAARAHGVTVLLDGQGMDEQWAGYSYYASPATAGLVQGSRDRALRLECLAPEFRALAEPPPAPQPFDDPVRNLQYRDLFVTKIPRALAYNDRASMRASTELREPFLDHRLVELAVRQPAVRKIAGGEHKRLLRQISRRWMDDGLVSAPKRPVQTPQREWLRGPLRAWSGDVLAAALIAHPGWLDRAGVLRAWSSYCSEQQDNSFFIWQWISLGLNHLAREVPCESA